MTEELLIEGCKKGDRASQKFLYDKYKDRFFGICIRYVKIRDAAEDVLMESFLSIFSNIDKFKGTGSFEGWMRKIVINNSINAYRKYIIERNVLSIDEQNYFDIEDKIVDTEDSETLLKMLNTLTLVNKIVFNLHEIDGYKHKDIAKLLDISITASKSRLINAKTDLRKIYDEYVLKRAESI